MFLKLEKIIDYICWEVNVFVYKMVEEEKVK